MIMKQKQIFFLTSITLVTVGLIGLTTILTKESEANNEANNNQSTSFLIAQSNSNNTDTIFYQEKGIAIKGTDAVAYFTEGKPVKGDKNFSYQWGNATWWFKNAENKNLFAQNPEKYAPQYGGFCAWAVSQNYTAPIDPQAWTIVDGKLYLNYNKRIRSRWEKDIQGNITKGDRNWIGILADLQKKQ